MKKMYFLSMIFFFLGSSGIYPDRYRLDFGDYQSMIQDSLKSASMSDFFPQSTFNRSLVGLFLGWTSWLLIDSFAWKIKSHHSKEALKSENFTKYSDILMSLSGCLDNLNQATPEALEEAERSSFGSLVYSVLDSKTLYRIIPNKFTRYHNMFNKLYQIIDNKKTNFITDEAHFIFPKVILEHVKEAQKYNNGYQFACNNFLSIYKSSLSPKVNILKQKLSEVEDFCVKNSDYNYLLNTPVYKNAQETCSNFEQTYNTCLELIRKLQPT